MLVNEALSHILKVCMVAESLAAQKPHILVPAVDLDQLVVGKPAIDIIN